MLEESIKHFLLSVDRIASALERIADQLEATPGALGGAILKGAKGARFDEGEASIPGPAEPDEQVVRRILSARGVTIGAELVQPASEKVMQDLLKFIGDRYSRTHKLLDRMKQTLATGAEFYFHLKGEEVTTINDIIHVSKHMTDLKLTSQHAYKSAPHFMLSATLPADASFREFIEHGWLDQYVHQEARRMLEKHRTGRKVCSVLGACMQEQEQPSLSLTTVMVVGGKELFWLQVSVRGGEDIQVAHQQLRDKLGLDVSHSWVICPELAAEQKERLVALGFTAVSVAEFSTQFAGLFARNRA